MASRSGPVYAGVEYRRQALRHGLRHTAPRQSGQNDATLILAGILTPLVTTPINAGNLELAVPAESWVLKGQVIGAADSEASPEEIDEERLLFRQRLASPPDSEAGVSRRGAAESAVAAVQSRLGAAVRRIGE